MKKTTTTKASGTVANLSKRQKELLTNEIIIEYSSRRKHDKFSLAYAVHTMQGTPFIGGAKRTPRDWYYDKFIELIYTEQGFRAITRFHPIKELAKTIGINL